MKENLVKKEITSARLIIWPLSPGKHRYLHDHHPEFFDCLEDTPEFIVLKRHMLDINDVFFMNQGSGSDWAANIDKFFVDLRFTYDFKRDEYNFKFIYSTDRNLWVENYIGAKFLMDVPLYTQQENILREVFRRFYYFLMRSLLKHLHPSEI